MPTVYDMCVLHLVRHHRTEDRPESVDQIRLDLGLSWLRSRRQRVGWWLDGATRQHSRSGGGGSWSLSLVSRDVRYCRRCSLLRMRFSALSRRGYFRQDPRTLRRRNGRRRPLRPRFCVLRLRLFSFCFGGGLAVRDFVQLAMSSVENGRCTTYIMMCVRHDGRLGRGVRVDSGLGSGGNQVDLDGLDVRVYF